ncbi:pectate lyase [Erwinia psidii]|uniref:pectate lyase n=1 Tax=Erwinia psidii TaxID=69224 RepID=A0A3N6SDN6_9GAMM|nr:pectate lyase [Erwinia psidii]MCX8957623.1 type III secretion protein HrpW [Erwinia psidii]MCX8960677.1 type III secretion protein HrpW [Erwinia psidii]RQM39560.1 type III secretion protein HrpW [Erwinia psidii]
MSALTLNTTIPTSSGRMQPGDNNVLSTGNSSNATQGQQSLDPQSIEQLVQMLAELLKPLLSSQTGDSSTNANGTSPLSGLGGQNSASGAAGSGNSPFAGLGNTGGVTGQNGAVSSSPQDASQSTLNDMSSNGLDQSISSDGQGGGTISDNPIMKALLKLIAQMMDAQNNQFGQPDSGDDSASGGGTTAAGTSTGSGNAAGGSSKGGTSLADSSASGGTSDSGISQGTANTAPISTAQGDSNAYANTVQGAGSRTPVSDQSDPTGSAGTGAAQDVTFPTASANPNVVHDTIVVKAGEVFDGKGQTFTAGSELGDGSQSESQKPLFKLEDGASLKNVVIGNNGADGIHLYGDAKIDNLHVTNVGEDAITVKANKEGKKSNVEISNSTFQNASDKIIQLNADTNLSVNNVKAKDFGTFVRTNGGQQGNWDLNLSHISAENGKFSFVKSDSEGLDVNTSDVSLDNVANHYKVPASANLTAVAS